MRKTFVLTFVLGSLILSGCGLNLGGETQANTLKGPSVIFNTDKGRSVITVEIADSSQERTTGLMYRKSLAEDAGMFFIFDDVKPLNFWMKNTLIPLDMIFFDADYKVIRIHKNVQPCKKDPCAVYSSDKPAKYVLEVGAGGSERMGLKDGDKAEIKL